jgi:hypothetical protein
MTVQVCPTCDIADCVHIRAARHAEAPAPAKSFWLVPATLAVGLILGAIQHHLI